METLEGLPLGPKAYPSYPYGLNLNPLVGSLMVGLVRPAPGMEILDLTGGELLGEIHRQLGKTRPRVHIPVGDPGAALLAWTNLATLGLEGEVYLGRLPEGSFSWVLSSSDGPRNLSPEEALGLLAPQGEAVLFLKPQELHGVRVRGLAEKGHVEGAIRLSPRIFGREGTLLLLRARGGRTKVYMMDTGGLNDLLGNEALIHFILRLYKERKPMEGFSLLVKAEGVAARGLDPRRYIGHPFLRRFP